MSDSNGSQDQHAAKCSFNSVYTDLSGPEPYYLCRLVFPAAAGSIMTPVDDHCNRSFDCKTADEWRSAATPPMLTVPRSNDERTALLWHYFRSVCKIFSCYDSFINPFRTEVHKLMSSSHLIYLCVLSMSAAHLQQNRPHPSLNSCEYLAKAVAALARQLGEIISCSATIAPSQDLDNILLAGIILGVSTSWHASSGLGLEHIVGCRAIFQRWLHSGFRTEGRTTCVRLNFFVGLLAYWETVAASLIDQDPAQLDYLEYACMKLPINTVPVHPWTGISSISWALLAKSICLARSKRKLVLMRNAYKPSATRSRLESLESQARTLERSLLHCVLPNGTKFEATYDEQTLPSHLEAIAQCCKLAAFIELYQAFHIAWDLQSIRSLLDHHFGQIYCGDKSVSNLEDGQVCVNLVKWLAVVMLEILRSIPPASNTRCVQHIMLLIGGTALTGGTARNCMHKACPVERSTVAAAGETALATGALGNLSFQDYPAMRKHGKASAIAPLQLEHSHAWREFVDDRLTHLRRIIHLDSIWKIQTLVRKVWSICNTSSRESYAQYDNRLHWIDVMEEHSLEFLF